MRVTKSSKSSRLWSFLPSTSFQEGTSRRSRATSRGPSRGTPPSQGTHFWSRSPRAFELVLPARMPAALPDDFAFAFAFAAALRLAATTRAPRALGAHARHADDRAHV